MVAAFCLNLCVTKIKQKKTLICYSGVINKLFSNLANSSLTQNWFWDMSSVSFSLCFLKCASMMVFSCAFILFIIVCYGSNFLSYLWLFLDCHISIVVILINPQFVD